MQNKYKNTDEKTVVDEQKFWDTHNPADFTDNLDVVDQFTSLKPSTRIITLRVPEHLLTNLRLIANKRDIPYQSLLKVFLQEKVNEELQTPLLQLKRKVVKKTVMSVLALLMTVSLTYMFVAQPIKAQGGSMDPNFPTDTYYVLDKVAYAIETPKRGDVVVFHSPSSPNSMFFKRIVGLPGERISIKNNSVYINGEKLYEPYIKDETVVKSFPMENEEITVPGNSYYVLGDNRDSSIDSREFGFLTKENITGKVSSCYWNCQ